MDVRPSARHSAFTRSIWSRSISTFAAVLSLSAVIVSSRKESGAARQPGGIVRLSPVCWAGLMGISAPRDSAPSRTASSAAKRMGTLIKLALLTGVCAPDSASRTPFVRSAA